MIFVTLALIVGVLVMHIIYGNRAILYDLYGLVILLVYAILG